MAGCAPAAGTAGTTLAVETTWTTPGGEARVVDCMPPRGTAPDVVRIVEGVSGAVPMRGELRIRFDYGRVVPWVRHREGQVQALAGPDALWLRTSSPVEGHEWASVSEFTVRAGERVPFVLTSPAAVPPIRVDEIESFFARVTSWTCPFGPLPTTCWTDPDRVE